MCFQKLGFMVFYSKIIQPAISLPYVLTPWNGLRTPNRASAVGPGEIREVLFYGYRRCCGAVPQ